MASWTRRAVVLGFCCGIGGVVAAGCADNTVTLFIRQVQAPDTGSCTYTADPAATALGFGVMDLMLRQTYRGALLVGSQMVARGSSEMARAESARIQLEEAEVRVEYTDGGEVTSFTIPGNGFVDPSSGTDPGWGLFLTVLVDSRASEKLRVALGVDGTTRVAKVGRIVSVVKVFGKTLGGTEVESGEFRYPIEVCYGCLVSFPAEYNDIAGQNQPNCDKVSATSTTADEACIFGQDQGVTCMECQMALGSGNPLCEP